MFGLPFHHIFDSNTKILGLNHRNRLIMRKLNPRKYKKYADDKLLSKKLLAKYRIKTPELFKIIRTKEQIEYINWSSLPKSFVIKPNRGTHGAGIIVFYGQKKGKLEWIMPNMESMSVNDIKQHLADIIDGKFSIDGKADVAFFEERIVNHKTLKPFSYRGIPDIRVIAYNSIPIMAELRLPTKESKGTANLHAGGIGVGIDIASGVTTTAIHRKGFDMIGDQYNEIEETLDSPKIPLQGIKIPFWDKILELTAKCQQHSKLGFLGVDIAIDAEKGPLILELNARPGLAIQLANQEGLLERINQVRRLKKKSVAKAIMIAKNLFGGEIEEQVESITGKEIIGLVETVTITPVDEVIEALAALKSSTKRKKQVKIPTEVIKAKIDTGARKSSIDYRLAIQLGYKELEKVQELFDKTYKTSAAAHEAMEPYKARLSEFDYISSFIVVRSGNGITIRPIIRANIALGGIKKTYILTVSNRSAMIYPVILGRKDLKEFLIDPSKTFTMR
ncbi:MAG: sugar-transfer associated ATP-grasp domain-containing protein [Candidatus Dojkabacteria bacterium]|nr:MAG: sugar-transfer associated ATP-grasp domain-containing protein [Candidatus Dojkabacteria bacterium]